MIQVTPQMRILLAVQPTDFRKGIDGLAQVCRQVLQKDPFSGYVFIFRNKRATAIKVLMYDGQGFWLCQKRLSEGRFNWQPLTLFLRVPNAPLDNNICERALKKAILHRKNALFYKTENGARVGDLFMSLIHTCNLAGVNPFDYLTKLQKHSVDLAQHPEKWLPWNYNNENSSAKA